MRALGWAAARLAVGAIALVVALVLLVLASTLLTDPVAAVAGAEASPEQVAAVRERLGMDRPEGDRIAATLRDVLSGDFGVSYTRGEPAAALVAAALPATVALALVATPVGLGLGVLSGLGLALLRRRAAGAGAVVLLAVQSVPGFVVAIVAVQLLAVRARLVPASGPGTLWLAGTLLGIGLALRLALLLGDRLTRLTREPFVLAAAGRGLSPGAVAVHHLLRPAAVVVVSYAAIQVGYLLGGSLVIETVFAYPGLGRLAVQALREGDLPVLLAAAAVAGLAFLVLRLVADLALIALDPRVRDGLDVGPSGAAS